ncbi:MULTISPECIES: acyl-CoA dehydrogenase [unclassified Saccharopolyspora]|uniref:acyl-CoA dehydrogenase family protein n=1 Tax=unclassified Saccharopolyspora TaxID=2646250 RepID=UPI001CD53A13|nr:MULTISPECIES: acyl-CoA dehydrogenase [unclassified Saccharopolyspora]MCA1191844.1 acyl-CoA dehydrogenase family protein [Saccharopolyspora sp. 6V]MCA1226053.1 acyl-CoA dehydrogenase family protein [Saccharopolyspora sp. 6M]MCA1281646.1 acyl-CoA dehydrogenase family protein [Saccharopolyspora sp. 7B]
MDIPKTPARFDATELATLLDGRWAGVRAKVREALEGTELPPGDHLDTEAHRAQTLEQLHLLVKSGIPEIGFPVAQGGRGDVGGSVVSLEMLAGNLSLMVKSGVQWGLFGGAVQALGTERHHERYLPSIMNLDLPGCFAMTETGHGSDVQHLRTTATYDPATEEFVVHTPHESARKEYIGNAARDGRMAVVFAQLITGGERHGVHALLVPLRDEQGAPMPGVHLSDCGRKAGLNGVDNGRITFDQVRVPRESLLNRYGDVAADGTYSSPIESTGKRFFTMLGTLIRGRISVAGTAGSTAKLALEIALRYATARRQFDRPGTSEETVVLDYLAHQRKLLPALAKSYALHFAQEQLVQTLHDVSVSGDERAQRELESRAAGLKAVTTWHATHAIQTAREACGGAGYLAENQLPQLKADTDVFTTFEGDNTVLLQLVAKGLLTDYKDQFDELGTVGMARFVADQFVGTVIERTAAKSLVQRLIDAARDDEDAVFDRGWQLKLFDERERHVLDGLARRLRRAAGKDADPFAVFNNAQDHVLRAARVHIDRVVLEAFVAGVERCPDPATAQLLERVCDLYVLSTIEEDRGWFLEHERITPRRAKAVTEAVNGLCQGLRPHAVELVEAFGLPRQWLTAPIATGAEHARQDAQRAHDRTLG